MREESRYKDLTDDEFTVVVNYYLNKENVHLDELRDIIGEIVRRLREGVGLYLDTPRLSKDEENQPDEHDLSRDEENQPDEHALPRIEENQLDEHDLPRNEENQPDEHEQVDAQEIANLQVELANLRLVIAQHERTIAQQADTIDQHEQTITQHEQTIAQQAGTITQHEQTIVQQAEMITQHSDTITHQAAVITQYENMSNYILDKVKGVYTAIIENVICARNTTNDSRNYLRNLLNNGNIEKLPKYAQEQVRSRDIIICWLNKITQRYRKNIYNQT